MMESEAVTGVPICTIPLTHSNQSVQQMDDILLLNLTIRGRSIAIGVMLPYQGSATYDHGHSPSPFYLRGREEKFRGLGDGKLECCW